jgi:hypothetical protein
VNSYDVPRPHGFYWVIWRTSVSDGPEPARFNVELKEAPPGAHWRTYLVKEWDQLATDDPYPEPDHVLGPIAPYDKDAGNAWGIYKRAVAFAKTLQPGNRMEITSDYCKMTLRNPSPAQLKRKKRKP